MASLGLARISSTRHCSGIARRRSTIAISPAAKFCCESATDWSRMVPVRSNFGVIDFKRNQIIPHCDICQVGVCVPGLTPLKYRHTFASIREQIRNSTYLMNSTSRNCTYQFREETRVRSAHPAEAGQSYIYPTIVEMARASSDVSLQSPMIRGNPDGKSNV